MPQDAQYAYAVARIRAIEKNMIDKIKMDRMIEAKTAQEVLKLVVESGYGDLSSDLTAVSNYERLLKEEQKKLYSVLVEIVEDFEIFNLVTHSADYHNVKVLLKSDFLGKEDDDILLETGTIPLSKLKVMIKERDFRDMSSYMRSAVEESIDTYNRPSDPQKIDLILDKANYMQMLKTLSDLDSELLEEVVEAKIDLLNIKTFLRIKRQGKSWDFLKKILLPGGHIDTDVFVSNIDSSYEAIIELFRYTNYNEICEKGIESYKNTGSLAVFEKLVDDYVISLAKKAKVMAFGIEPLICHFIGKENEIKNIRIIMVGKINNVPNETIRERLREAYV